MMQSDVEVGKVYRIRHSSSGYIDVQVTAIHCLSTRTIYSCRNLRTDRVITVKSARKFKFEVNDETREQEARIRARLERDAKSRAANDD